MLKCPKCNEFTVVHKSIIRNYFICCNPDCDWLSSSETGYGALIIRLEDLDEIRGWIAGEKDPTLP